MRKIGGILMAAACAAVLVGCPKKAPPGPPPSGTIAENLVTVTATVEKVDVAKRLVTLKGADGKSVTVHADDRVKNLAQVHKGDQVVASYYESIAYDVKRPGEAQVGVEEAGTAAAAKPGEKPAGVGAAAVTVTSKITSIDKTNQTVTLEGPDGDSVTFKVRDPSKLDRVQVGDLVQITYSEALAVSVEAAPK